MWVNLEVPQHFFRLVKEISYLKLHYVFGDYEEKLERTMHKKWVEDFFSECGQVRRKLRICTHLLKNSLTENFTFWVVVAIQSCSENKCNLDNFFLINTNGGEICNRSSHSQTLYITNVLKALVKLIGNTLWWSVIEQSCRSCNFI